MSEERLRAGILPWSGLLIGPGFWAIATEAGQILPYLDCGAKLKSSTLLTACAILVSLGGGALSWWAGRSGANADTSPYPEANIFICRLSALGGVMFAFALGLQMLATLVLSACER